MKYYKSNGKIVKHCFDSKTEANYWAAIVDRATKPVENFALQFGQDAAILVLHDEFGFGQDRIEKFCLRFVDTLHEICDLLIRDEKDDPDLVYSKAKIDAKIKAACGRNFAEWDVRYGKKKIPDEMVRVD